MGDRPATQGVTQYDHDVVIIGCGPTGATLANLLAQSDVNVLVLDREPDIYNLPRAVHFDDETMRVFQTVGIADELEEKSRVNPGMRFVDDSGTVLLDWSRPAGLGRHGWHTSYRLHQPDLERLLRNSLKQYAHCTVELGHEMLSFEQVTDAVELVYQDKQTKQIKTCKAKYVVGCDGANSSLRTAIRADMDDLGFKERWLVVDVLLKQDKPELGDYTVQYCSFEQPMTYCRNPGLRRRWEMALPDSLQDKQALDNARIWSSLSRWISPAVATIERKAIYTFRSQLATQWRDRQVLIAGDAAHLTPPFMGQGMCAGIRDATNLAWKLAMVIKNECTDALLDSYQQERQPHVREYINTAIALGELINSLDKKSVQSIASGGDASKLKMASIAPRLGPTNMVTEHFQNGLHAGKLFDQLTLSNGALLDDCCGYQHVVISRRSATSVEVRAGDNDKLILSATDQSLLLNMLEQWQVETVLIRPDRYVLASTNIARGHEELTWQNLMSSAKS